MENGDLFATREILTPAELTRRARHLLESGLGDVWLEGEISNLSSPASGHRYFTLKDDRAQVRCALFRNRPVSVPMRNGQQVLVRARVSLYEARGEFQLIVEAVEAAGEGRLQLAFETLKKKLNEEGLFAPRDRPLPRFPAHLVIVSSPSGAALQDVLSVLQRRYPVVRVTLVPSPVQGAEAPAALLAALAAAERLNPDAIVLTRGGGSLEDLWAFNDEALARRIRACTVPVISAVGHETDFSISDFVADIRAATPSAAAELLVPDQQELMALLQALQRQLTRRLLGVTEQTSQRLDHAHRRLLQAGPNQRLGRAHERLNNLRQRLNREQIAALRDRAERLKQLRHRLQQCTPKAALKQLQHRVLGLDERRAVAIGHRLEQSRLALAASSRALQAVNPLAVLKRGYSVTQLADGRIVRSATDTTPGQALVTRLGSGRVHSTVVDLDREDT